MVEAVQVNKHHLWWERNWYTERNDKRLRQLGGFVVPTTVYSHQLLHAQMRPMVKPTARLRDDIIDFASAVPLEHRFSVAEATADWLAEQHDTHHSDEYAYRALRLAHHLRKQVGYLAIHDLPERRR
jgi:hypothetical protein